MVWPVDLNAFLWYFYHMPLDRNAIIKEAQKLAAKGQYDKAISEWRRLAREFPKDANIYNTIGDLSLKKNAKDDAVDAYKKAADILSADGFTSKAIALYKKILNIDPKKVEIHIALADLNAEKGLVANALESYKIAADYYIQKNDMARALGIFQKMADLNPTNAVFRVKLAEMYLKEGLKKEAAKAFLEAADVHMSKEAFHDARQMFERVLAIDPNNKDVYFKAGVVYFKEGKFGEACKAFKPAFEADPSNNELFELYIDALSRAGREAEAEEVIRKVISQDATRLDLRERLLNILLSTKDYDRALSEASALVDLLTGDREYERAEGILKNFISQVPDNIGAYRKLADLYISIQREEDAAKAIINIADILISKGGREEARAELSRALEIFPGFSELREKLEDIERVQAPEPAEAAISEASPVIETTETTTVPAEPAGLEAIPSEPARPEAAAEDPAVLEAFTEIEILLKYGLLSKAVEQLEGLVGKFPESLQVRTRLKDLYIEQGNTEKAAEQAIALADIYARLGMNDQAESVLRQGLEIAPDHSEILNRLGMAPSAALAEPAPAASLEEALSLDEVIPPPFEIPTIEEPALPPQPPEPPKEPAMPKDAPAFEPLATVDISEIWAEAEFFFQQGLFDEAKKRYEEILILSPDNKRARERLAELSREKEDVQEFSKLTEAVEGLEGLVPSDALQSAGFAESTSDEEAVRTLMEEIKQLEKAKRGSAHLEAPPPFEHKAEVADRKDGFFYPGTDLGTEAPAPSAEEEGSEDFFDLAAELRAELGDISLQQRPSIPAEEQTLDDIFEEFKRGVEIQASREESDIHYNLGIAYKEMGLLDEAISEFLMTREGEPMFVESRHMLGLCFMEQGEYLKAATEIRNALGFLESLGGDQRQRIEMLYDLGLAYQGAGNTREALNAFQQVHDAAPSYRDTASKIKELQAGDFISLDQLKEEIEKEISTKFFEEGERIEKEEKTKKNEKVKG